MLILKVWRQNAEDRFSQALIVSIAFHLVVMLGFSLQSFFKTKPALDISQAISVNLSDFPVTDKLPEKIQPQALEVAAPEPEPVEIEAEQSKATPVQKQAIEKKIIEKKPIEKIVNLKQNKLKQKQALERIKKMAALDQIKKSLQSDAIKKLNSSQKTNVRRVIAAGSPLNGLDKIEAAEYLLLLDSRIKQSWTLPQWLISQKLKAQVLVKFNQQGQVLSANVIQSSGNASYDRYCMQAVESASPFPVVPEKFSEKFKTDGLVIGFPE